MARKRIRRVTREVLPSIRSTGKPIGALAIAALVLYALILPGLGAIIGGRSREGYNSAGSISKYSTFCNSGDTIDGRSMDLLFYKHSSLKE